MDEPFQNPFAALLEKLQIKSFLRRTHTTQGQVLLEKAKPVRTVYFPIDAVISLIATLEDGTSVDTAMIGRSGGVGLLVALDGKVSLNSAVVQLGGDCWYCDARDFGRAALAHADLHSLTLRHEQAIFAEAQQAAACNAAHGLERRMAKWLLRARDLKKKDELDFTQQIIAEMLGAGRTSVSLAAHALQAAGHISYSRGRVSIVNSAGLKSAACSCYTSINEAHGLAYARDNTISYA